MVLIPLLSSTFVENASGELTRRAKGCAPARLAIFTFLAICVACAGADSLEIVNSAYITSSQFHEVGED